MDLIECYLMTSRIVLQAKCNDPSSWQAMHTLLPNLRKHLSCRVCHKLLDRLNSNSSDFTCTLCSNNQISENTSISLIQCYKKLCAYIQQLPLYDVMRSRSEDNDLVEIISEVISVPLPINGHIGLVNGTTNKKQEADKVNNHNKIVLNSSSDIQLPIEKNISKDYVNLQTFGEQSQKHRIQNKPTNCTIPKKKKNERRLGCRCGNATTTPGKLTCFGQRCPCYTEQKSCDRCKCRGCRNPRQNKSNNDNNLEIDKIRLKPVTLDLASSLKSTHLKYKPVINTYSMHDIPLHEAIEFTSQSPHFNQGKAEVTLGHVNSIFHSP